jgi:4-diphosphocytidyl-2-C-methyl-D-erythritol kinase
LIDDRIRKLLLLHKVNNMLSFPNAKINIGLNIIERRADQFHNIESIFYPVPIADVLEILEVSGQQGKKAEMIVTGTEIPGDSACNLCVKAYEVLDVHFHLPPVKIHLHKIIPTGAGLGGGSADGAFTLTLLNKLFDLNLSNVQLVSFASKLGSDCPFFIENRPAFGTEKGNKLQNIPLDLTGLYFVLIKPRVSVGTAEAYKGVIPHKPKQSINTLIQLDINEWKENIVNDFEQSIFPNHPVIKEMKDEIYRAGAVYASMSGSGSAVYGIFEKETNLEYVPEHEFYWAGFL